MAKQAELSRLGVAATVGKRVRSTSGKYLLVCSSCYMSIFRIWCSCKFRSKHNQTTALDFDADFWMGCRIVDPPDIASILNLSS